MYDNCGYGSANIKYIYQEKYTDLNGFSAVIFLNAAAIQKL